VSHAPVHAVDWLKTLYHFATGGQARASPSPSPPPLPHATNMPSSPPRPCPPARRLAPLPLPPPCCPTALQPLVPSASEPPYLDGDGVDVFDTLSRGTAVRDELL
jgi:hypothetical protein